MDYEEINAKLNKIQSNYDNDVLMFKQFSPVGDISYSMRKNINESEFNIINDNINIKDIDIDKTVKQLLKIIHPDKIKIIFGSEIPELLICSNEIIQKNLSIFQAITLLHKNLTTELFYNICHKIKLSNKQINSILQINIEESIDNHFDKTFLDLMKKYNDMKSKTLYNYIRIKVEILFNNLCSNYDILINQIKNKLNIINNLSLNSEEKLMSCEEFLLENTLNDKMISLEELTNLYPDSEYAKTISFIKQHLVTKIVFEKFYIKIEKYMYRQFNLTEHIDICTKNLYINFKYKISCPNDE